MVCSCTKNLRNKIDSNKQKIAESDNEIKQIKKQFTKVLLEEVCSLLTIISANCEKEVINIRQEDYINLNNTLCNVKKSLIKFRDYINQIDRKINTAKRLKEDFI